MINEYQAVSWDWRDTEKPLRARKAKVYKVTDLFHKSVTDEQLDKIFAVMALTPRHTYQVLTKRPGRMLEYLENHYRDQGIHEAIKHRMGYDNPKRPAFNSCDLPLKNCWLGVTVETQRTADERIPLLLQTPAAIRLLSCEPLLEAIDIREGLTSAFCTRCDWAGENGDWNPDRELEECPQCGQTMIIDRQFTEEGDKINWVIVGGESGPKARPCDISWIRSIVQQCKKAETPVFVKQLGKYPTLGMDTDAPILYERSTGKGSNPQEWPEDLRVREFPKSPNNANHDPQSQLELT